MSVMLTSARSGMHRYDATNRVPRRSAVARASCGPMNPARRPPVRTSEMARPRRSGATASAAAKR